MNVSQDPFVSTIMNFQLGPSFPERVPVSSPVVEPFGIRYAVSPVIEAGNSNQPTTKTVSINAPTGTDGTKGQTPTDDTITQGFD